MAVVVNIYIKDNSITPYAISGVTVAIVNPTTYAIVANAVSDINGLAAFLLPGSTGNGTTYEARFFKLGVVFSNPVQIQIQEPLVTTNTFDVAGTLVGSSTFGFATDPRCCRVVGRFMHITNLPMSNIVVRIMQINDDPGFQIPKIVDGNLISGAVLEVRTDANGYISVDLLRTGNYWCMFAGEDDTVWNMLIPDRPSANLTDLLFPQPVSGQWDQTIAPNNAMTIHVGTSTTVPLTLAFSDFETQTVNIGKWVSYVSSNPNAAIIDAGTGAIMALAAGTTTISVVVPTTPIIRPVRVPTYSISIPLLTITVVP